MKPDNTTGYTTVSTGRGWPWRYSRALTLLGAAALALAGGAAHADNPCQKGKADLFLRRQMADAPRTGWAGVILKLGGTLTPPQRAEIARLGGYVYRHLGVIESVVHTWLPALLRFGAPTSNRWRGGGLSVSGPGRALLHPAKAMR